MVRIVPDVIVHKSDMSVGVSGGGKDKMVSFISVLENKPGHITNEDGMNALSMEISTVGRMCSDVVCPFGS